MVIGVYKKGRNRRKEEEEFTEDKGGTMKSQNDLICTWNFISVLFRDDQAAQRLAFWNY